MTAIQDPRQRTALAIYESYEKKHKGGFRPHLGASLIGHHCNRYLWLTFRFARETSFPGRLLRLFDTGHREEERIVSDLEAIGCEVYSVDPSTGRQFNYSTLGGHFGGSMDAAVRGLPEAPDTWHVAEFKTHNQKSFDDLTKNGVEKSKPQHFAQMQVYMGFTGMTRAVYIAVNKNTDEIYTERVRYDAKTFKALVDRAERVIFSKTPLEKISNDPAWYQCKWCDYQSICHGTATPNVTCRSCTHSTPVQDGQWSCAISQPMQPGCQEHRYIPILLDNFAEPVDASAAGNWVLYRHKTTGNEFVNGSIPGGYSSQEIQLCEAKEMLGDEAVNSLKNEFDGQVVG